MGFSTAVINSVTKVTTTNGVATTHRYYPGEVVLEAYVIPDNGYIYRKNKDPQFVDFAVLSVGEKGAATNITEYFDQLITANKFKTQQ
jgi:hypothetical protein